MFDFKLKKEISFNCNNRDLYSLFLSYINTTYDNDVLLLTPSLTEANRIYNLLSTCKENVYLFLENEYLSSKALIMSPEFKYNRLNFLNNSNFNEKKIIITDINGYTKKLPSYSIYTNMSMILKINDTIKKHELVDNLIKIGYERTSLVTEPGEYALRGYIIDVFPFGYEKPVRIELFDNDIECIKYFNIETQISCEKIDTINIKPIIDSYEDNSSSLIDYLNNPLLIVQDKELVDLTEKNINEQKKYYNDIDLLNYKRIKSNKKIYVNVINDNLKADFTINAKNITEKLDGFDGLKNFIESHKNITILSSNKKLIDSIKKLNIQYLKYMFSDIEKSFIYNNEYYISLNEVFGKKVNSNYNTKTFNKNGKHIKNLNNIKIGDYVVHKNYGIGIYAGIETIDRKGVKKDYILLKYKGTDKLYIPVSSLTTLYKYSSKDGKQPKLNKLNSMEWEKTKHQIRKKIKDISIELLRVSKERNKSNIVPMESTMAEELIFANEFDYEETLDQIKAISEISSDLEKSKPMDRLLCGDVGYGKTEVIFRSIFKTVLNGYQVVYLCPTTLLSSQQYYSAKSRFKSFGLNIELVNRYTSTKELNRIIQSLKDGVTDVVFGTHKLFNEKFEYKNLGLLVIDEEHKFGVEHKEKIKQLKNTVHVLSVSATPIPRSLQMSLVGIRDMSLITTAPKERYPIQTYVIQFNYLLIKEVIEKEFARDGQTFILCNNIEKMPKIMSKLKELMPQITFDYAHGKMSKEESEERIEKFLNNKTNVLLTTTIIENGIDIPNANTIIVLDSDMFGLSQLYQIRGRVGRSNKIAYAYLTYEQNKIFSEQAKKRLEAIKEFTELGSGYKIAMRDLSIRGAGDILGSEQAGFIDSVGVDMYLDLVNEELCNNKKETIEKENLNISDVETHIDSLYSEEDDIIIDLHEKINSIKNQNDYETVKREIIDRFGTIDVKLERYMKQELLEALFNEINVKIMENNDYKISFIIKKDLYSLLNIEDLFIYASKISTKFNFSYRSENIVISLTKINIEADYLDYIIKLLSYLILKIKESKNN